MVYQEYSEGGFDLRNLNMTKQNQKKKCVIHNYHVIYVISTMDIVW
jgi:hypothetical protein